LRLLAYDIIAYAIKFIGHKEDNHAKLSFIVSHNESENSTT